jgi:hypothetical protein
MENLQNPKIGAKTTHVKTQSSPSRLGDLRPRWKQNTARWGPGSVSDDPGGSGDLNGEDQMIQPRPMARFYHIWLVNNGESMVNSG